MPGVSPSENVSILAGHLLSSWEALADPCFDPLSYVEKCYFGFCFQPVLLRGPTDGSGKGSDSPGKQVAW